MIGSLAVVVLAAALVVAPPASPREGPAPA